MPCGCAAPRAQTHSFVMNSDMWSSIRVKISHHKDMRWHHRRKAKAVYIAMGDVKLASARYKWNSSAAGYFQDLRLSMPYVEPSP